MGRYTHESWIPTVIPLVTEKDLRNELMGLYNVCKKSKDGRIIDPDTRKKLEVGGFLVAAVNGLKTEFLVYDTRGFMSDSKPILLNTKRLSDAVGEWNFDRGETPGTCVHHSEDNGDHGDRACEDLKILCPYAEACKDEDRHYQNRRFGAIVPKELKDIIAEFVHEREKDQ